MDAADIDQQRRVAWVKYYKQKSQTMNVLQRNIAMTSLILKQWRKTCGDEEIVWQFASINTLTMRFYTQHLCGSKTHMELIKTKNGVVLDHPYYAHMTAEGEEYKRWSKNDTPCYYMKKYDITPEYFFLLDSGTFALKQEYLMKMSAGHQKSLLQQINMFAAEYDLLDDNTQYEIKASNYVKVKVACPNDKK